MMIGGSVLALCTSWGSAPENLDLPAFLAIAVIVVIGTAGSFSLFLKGSILIDLVKATLLGCLEPFSATLLSALLLQTVFGSAEPLGFACILTTVMLSVKKDLETDLRCKKRTAPGGSFRSTAAVLHFFIVFPLRDAHW